MFGQIVSRFKAFDDMVIIARVVTSFILKYHLKAVRCNDVVLNSPVPCDLHHFVLYVLGQTLLQGLGDHGDFIPVDDITQTSLSLLTDDTTLSQ